MARLTSDKGLSGNHIESKEVRGKPEFTQKLYEISPFVMRSSRKA